MPAIMAVGVPNSIPITIDYGAIAESKPTSDPMAK